MKKIIVSVTACVMLFAACTKAKMNPSAPPEQLSLVGKWNIDVITTYAYDAGGLRDSTVYQYPVTPGSFYSFLFNSDNSWTESLSASSPDSLLVASNGTYAVTSDTTFTLMYPAASSARQEEPCTILSLTGSLFIFSKQLSTVFNGADSGYINYVFKLSK